MFDDAVIQVLKDEGGYFVNKKTGEIVNFGITLSFVRSEIAPNAPASFILSLNPTAAKAIYLKYFWNKYNLDKIVSPSVASLLFYLGVNQGPPTAAKHAQQACGMNGHPVTVDSSLGQNTVAALNACDAKAVHESICILAETRYREVAKNPALTEDLSGWLTRLNRYRQNFTT